jgi:P4 family phage/plasmid primase-like protien
MNYLPETNYLVATHNISSIEWMHKMSGQRLTPTQIDFWKLQSSVPKDATDGADFIAEQIPSCLSYNANSKTWYVWNGKVHTPLTANTVPTQLIDILGYAFKDLDALLNMYKETGTKNIKANNLSEAETKKKIAEFTGPIIALRKQWSSFAFSLNSNKGVKDVLNKLERKVAKGAAHFENDRQWLVVRNGVIDLADYRKTGVVSLLAHDASRPVHRYFDADYDPASGAETWKDFLSSSIVNDGGDTVKLLQKAVGAAFSAEEKPRALFNLLGAPASGKSVFLSVFDKLGQAYSVMPNNQAIQLNNGDTNFYQDALRNKRFVGFSEVQGKKPLDDGFLKGILGGDTQNTRQMRQMEIPWKPQCVLFIASNMALKFNTRDEATFIKILPIPFPHSFTETDPEHRMDRELENKVLEERNGILNWVLEGMKAFWAEGLAPTAAVMEAMDGNKTANSHALQFMEALIEAGHIEKDNMAPVSGCLPIGTAYEMFGFWASNQGIKNIPGKQTFTSDVADFYYGKKKSGTWTFIGLKKSPELQVNLSKGISLAHLAYSL